MRRHARATGERRRVLARLASLDTRKETLLKGQKSMVSYTWPINTDNSFKFMLKKKHYYKRKEVATVA